MASPGEDLYLWSTTAASNNSADALINWAEGQLPSTVNDSARSMMAAVAKQRDVRSGAKTTGGSANTHTLTSGVGYTALPNPFLATWKAGFTNTGATTLNVDAIGAVSIKTIDGSALSGGQIRVNHYYCTLYDGTNHILLNPEPAFVSLASGASGSVAALSFTLSDAYDVYDIILSKFIVATPGDYPFLRISEDNGSSYKSGATDYRYGLTKTSDATTGNEGSTGNTGIQLGASGGMAAAGSGGLFQIRLCDVASTTTLKRVIYDASYDSFVGTQTIRISGAGAYATDTSAITNARIFLNGGTNFTCNYTLTGRRN